MTEKEAIEYFYRIMESGTVKSDEQQIAYEVAIAALEKQIPKKILEPKPFPNDDSPIHFDDCVGKCPSCGHVLFKGIGLHKGCPYCLQAIDWSENPKD